LYLLHLNFEAVTPSLAVYYLNSPELH